MFRIRLKDAHKNKGVSFYRVAKDTGLSNATVIKYADADFVDSPYIPMVVVSLCNYYGLNWRDPSVIQVVEEGKAN